jgi:hypothetical protein
MGLLVASMLRTLAFGDLETGIWGAGWGGEEPFLAVGVGLDAPGASLDAAALAGTRADEDWRLEGAAVELVISADVEPAVVPDSAGFDQLCRIRGTATVSGASHEVDCVGRRGTRNDLELATLDSLRDISVWFGPEHGVALTALRPEGVSGHGEDRINVAVFEAGQLVQVADPRLSTTYGSARMPSRASLELWLETDEEEDDTPQHARRLAGEALGGCARGNRGGANVQANVFRWHISGQDGCGVYMVVRPA